MQRNVTAKIFTYAADEFGNRLDPHNDVNAGRYTGTVVQEDDESVADAVHRFAMRALRAERATLAPGFDCYVGEAREIA